MKVKRYYIGDSCICWSLGNEIKEEYSIKILQVYNDIKTLQNKNALNILDIIPAYNSLAIHFLPGSDIEELVSTVSKFFNVDNPIYSNSVHKGKTIHLPVVYNGEDLSRVAELNRLTIQKVIEIHCSKKYIVAMIGFRPHFPYLLGMDTRLETQRLEKPRLIVPKGSVAIGGKQTGIYPEESPGGWNIIGLTNTDLLIQITPGDKIIFKRVESLNGN